MYLGRLCFGFGCQLPVSLRLCVSCVLDSMSAACLLAGMSGVCVLASDVSCLPFAGIGQMFVFWIRMPGACVLDGYFCHMYSTVYNVQYVRIGSL